MNEAAEILAARDAFQAALHALRVRAGYPSDRKLATLSDGEMSHTAVGKAFRGKSLPLWGTLAPLLELLGGDMAELEALYAQATYKRPEFVCPSCQARLMVSDTKVRVVT